MDLSAKCLNVSEPQLPPLYDGSNHEAICGAVSEGPTDKACRAQAGQVELTDLQLWLLLC